MGFNILYDTVEAEAFYVRLDFLRLQLYPMQQSCFCQVLNHLPSLILG